MGDENKYIDPAVKIAEELYDKFYEAIPTRVMHFDMHRELALNNALISVKSTKKMLERINDGMMSRTCRDGSDPSQVLVLWKNVETKLLIRKKELKEEAK